jgi:phosphocarrier protein FPr
MVSLLLVSHSRALAEATLALAQQMTSQAQVTIAIAAGVGDEHRELGTDAVEISAAIESVCGADGAVVLMDLGSAILSAEMALDLLPAEIRSRTRLCAAPFVEGTLAAAVQASLGSALDDVCAAALGALQPKREHLGSGNPETHVADKAIRPPATAEPAHETEHSIVITLTNPHGLHARPAARFVQTVARFDAQVWVSKANAADTPASGKSLNQLATLGAQQGDTLHIRASGPQAIEVLAALQLLAQDRFDDTEDAQAGRLPTHVTPASNSVVPEGALRSIPVAPGIAIGPLHRLETRFVLSNEAIVAGDAAAEWGRLQGALASVSHALEQRQRDVAASAGEAQAAIFAAHQLLLQDEVLLDAAHQHIQQAHASAEGAWQQIIDELAAQYRILPDPYQQQRAADVLDAGQQVLVALRGAHGDIPALTIPTIVLADELTPNQVAQLNGPHLLGLITRLGGGSATSHAAILARALGIPTLAGIGDALDASAEGTLLGMDGEAGALWIEPSATVVQALSERRAIWQAEQAQLRHASQSLTFTQDGRRVEVAANLSGLVDAQAALSNGAEAVGVLRTEFLYLMRDSAPSEDEQVQALQQIAAALQGRPVIVRTLDVGGDKVIPYVAMPREANPYLGVRAIRLSLQQPALFTTQVRAILRAAANAPLRILLPMVTLSEELAQARALIEQAHLALQAEGVAHGWPLPVGIMVETPAAALLASALARDADFFSIGTNDLTQYTLAAERGHPHLGALSDALHPSILRLIREVTDAVHQHGKWAAVCGEVAADPLAVPILVGLGVDELSMNVAAIPAVKAIVRRLEMPAVQALAQECLRQDNAPAVRGLAQAFMQQLPIE